MRIVIEWPDGEPLPTRVTVSGYRWKTTKPTPEEIQGICKMYLAHERMQGIADRYHRTLRQIKYICKTHVPPEFIRDKTFRPVNALQPRKRKLS